MRTQRVIRAAWHRDTTLSIVLLTLALMTVGCASSGSLESPEVTLSGVQITDMTVFETTIETRLRVGNPNNESLTFDGASFKLELGDRKIGRGMTAERFTIPRLSTEVVSVTFHVNNAAAILRLKEVLEKQAVSYTVKATMFVERGGSTRKLKTERTGEIDLSAMSVATPIDG